MLPTRVTNCRVLYVEDEPLIAMDGEATLRDLGFTDIVVAMTFEDAQSAIEGGTFELALMDINLGGGRTSLPLARTLADRGTRIIFASGYNSSGQVLRVEQGYRIEKPIDEAMLSRAIAHVMEVDG